MSELKVLYDLEGLLQSQLDLFDQVQSVQENILSQLGEQINFAKVMELLSQKEELVKSISQNSEEHKPFIADYMQRKTEFTDHPKSQLIENLLSQIETKVELIQIQDEKMVSFFQSKPASQADQDPNNLINAYRGLR